MSPHLCQQIDVHDANPWVCYVDGVLWIAFEAAPVKCVAFMRRDAFLAFAQQVAAVAAEIEADRKEAAKSEAIENALRVDDELRKEESQP